jgi:nucleoside-diphosphate-sugar epimerase
LNFTILGGTGFVGSHVARYLTGLGHTALVPDRSQSLVDACSGAHVIYAIGLTADFRERPFDTIEAHVSVAADLLRQADFKSFLYLSSTRVYVRSSDTSEDRSLSVLPEDPSDLYNISKLAGEAVCLASGRTNVRIARLSNVVGPQTAATESFAGALCREGASGHIQLKTDLNSSKDYIWIDDVAALLLRISLAGRHKIYNVASGMQISHAQWISAISTQTGCSFSVDDNAPMSSFPPIATSRIREEFDFHPQPVLQRISTILEHSSATF